MTLRDEESSVEGVSGNRKREGKRRRERQDGTDCLQVFSTRLQNVLYINSCSKKKKKTNISGHGSAASVDKL